MKVIKEIVYRIVPFDSDLNVGDSILLTKSEKERSVFKQCLEDSLEKCRPNGFPSREKCLFVCFSKENAYEWAYIKYARHNTKYILFTLEVTGELYWLKSDCYNLIGNSYTQEQLNQACIDYWNSMTENRNDLKLDRGYEGLFVGENIIISIEYKNYFNGESYDIK